MIKSSYCTNPNPKRRDCKLDCVKGCTVVEIKPKDATDLGWKQARAYVAGLKRMYQSQGNEMFKEPYAVFRKCVSTDGKELNVTPDVDSYDFCPKPGEIAPKVDKINVDIPSIPE